MQDLFSNLTIQSLSIPPGTEPTIVIQPLLAPLFAPDPALLTGSEKATGWPERTLDEEAPAFGAEAVASRTQRSGEVASIARSEAQTAQPGLLPVDAPHPVQPMSLLRGNSRSTVENTARASDPHPETQIPLTSDETRTEQVTAASEGRTIMQPHRVQPHRVQPHRPMRQSAEVLLSGDEHMLVDMTPAEHRQNAGQDRHTLARVPMREQSSLVEPAPVSRSEHAGNDEDNPTVSQKAQSTFEQEDAKQPWFPPSHLSLGRENVGGQSASEAVPSSAPQPIVDARHWQSGDNQATQTKPEVTDGREAHAGQQSALVEHVVTPRHVISEVKAYTELPALSSVSERERSELPALSPITNPARSAALVPAPRPQLPVEDSARAVVGSLVRANQPLDRSAVNDLRTTVVRPLRDEQLFARPNESEAGERALKRENTPATAEENSAPVIQVSIGRVSVRVTTPAQATPAARRGPRPSLSLNDYFKQRRREGP